jgi:hypothetical protein
MDKRYRHRVGVRAEICFDLVLDSSDLTPEQLRDAVAVALNKSADDERGFPVPILLDGKVFPEWNSVDPEMEPMHVLDPQSVRSLDCFEIHSPESSKVQ